MRRIGLAFGEMFHGLRRSLTMTISVILTVAVSLTLLGTGILISRQVDKMKDYWYDRVEVSVFLCGKASDPALCPAGPVTDAERQAINAKLTATPQVEQVFYESQAEAFEHFKEQFKDSPILDNVTVDSMPESYRVKLRNAEDFAAVAVTLKGVAGIEQVQDQQKLLDKFFKLLGGLQAGAIGVAIAMLVVTVLLIFNTMRVAAYSRRREIGIMKHVGASHWFIRAPFILEAAFMALIGGAFAAGALFIEQTYLVEKVLQPAFRFTTFIGWDTVVPTMLSIVIFGVLVSVIAATLSIWKYLRV